MQGDVQRPKTVVEVAHTGLTVRDLDRAIAMFTRCLGFELTARHWPADPTIVARITGVIGAEAEIAYLSGGGHRLELLAYRAPPGRRSATARPCDPGHLHLAFHVADIGGVVAAMAEFGFNPVAPAATAERGPRQGKRAVYLRDADGLTIELMEP